MNALREDREPGALSAPAEQRVRPLEPASAMVREASLSPVPARGNRLLERLLTRGLVPAVSHQIQYVGRSGVIGLALLVFSLVCFVSANSPLRTQLADLRTQLTDAERSHALRHRTGLDVSPAVQLRTLVSRLPPRTELPQITERIVQQADTAGLTLDKGSYEVAVVRSGQIARARLSFPVHGSYPNIRKFIDGTLAVVPGAAVDGLRLERKEIGATEVDAEIRFAVYTRNSP